MSKRDTVTHDSVYEVFGVGAGRVLAMPLSFRQIAEDLENRILTRAYPPGAKLPSLANLADIYSVSLSTAQKARLLLDLRGLTTTKPGRGVYVREEAS